MRYPLNIASTESTNPPFQGPYFFWNTQHSSQLRVLGTSQPRVRAEITHGHGIILGIARWLRMDGWMDGRMDRDRCIITYVYVLPIFSSLNIKHKSLDVACLVDTVQPPTLKITGNCDQSSTWVKPFAWGKQHQMQPTRGQGSWASE